MNIPVDFGGLKSAIWQGADRIGLTRAAGQWVRPAGWTILWAHGVCADSARQFEQYPRDIRRSVFRAQLEHLLDEGYRFISMSEGVEGLRKGSRMDRMATLTFDDGFGNVLERAYPAMVELGLKGCLYAIADYVGTTRVLWTDMVDLVCWQAKTTGGLELRFPAGSSENQSGVTQERLERFDVRNDKEALEAGVAIKRKLRALPESSRRETFVQIEEMFGRIPAETIPEEYRFASWEELRALDPEVLEVGNHSMTHPNLANVSGREEMEREIGQARLKLEEGLGRAVRHFCYPAGSYNSEVVKQVAASGHESAVTIRYGVNRVGQSPFELSRLGLPGGVSQFKARVSGLEGSVLRATMAMGR